MPIAHQTQAVDFQIEDYATSTCLRAGARRPSLDLHAKTEVVLGASTLACVLKVTRHLMLTGTASVLKDSEE